MTTPYALIKYDTEKEEAVRDSRGFCIEVPKGERQRTMSHFEKSKALMVRKRPDLNECVVDARRNRFAGWQNHPEV
jgi:citronellyl-CoA synthetase